MTTRKRITYLISFFMIASLPASGVAAQEQGEAGTITFEVGEIRMSTLCEGSQDGNSQILTGATPEMLKTYLPDGTYPMATNVFLLSMNDKHILVDAGYGRQLFDHLQALDVTPDGIDAVLLTHMHGDHIG
ncbi:MAG: MBL fold metallo-hydrolase, partial [Tannerella sp.]|nr:MBL fold metallo-hydrolase [Tannerella sp.]